MPGVSIRQAPAGNGMRARNVVVWRPRESLSRTSPVFMRSSPRSVLVSVDLPAPDDPTSTTVWPGSSHGASCATLSGSLALTVNTGTPCAVRSASTSTASAAYSVRSALVSTTTGCAPPPPTSSR